MSLIQEVMKQEFYTEIRREITHVLQSMRAEISISSLKTSLFSLEFNLNLNVNPIDL